MNRIKFEFHQTAYNFSIGKTHMQIVLCVENVFNYHILKPLNCLHSDRFSYVRIC